VFRRTDLCKHPEDYFQDAAGYIICDSAFRINNFLQKPFIKRQLREDPTGGDRKTFNVMLSSARVNVEHTFGLIKVRFPLARCMAVVLTDEAASHERAVRYLRVLSCLHNFLLDMQDDWEPTPHERQELNEQMDHAFATVEASDWRGYAEENGGVENPNLDHQSRLGELKREYLMQQVREWPGRCRRRPGVWWYD
jgi:DDE superfamily endonuclease